MPFRECKCEACGELADRLMKTDQTEIRCRKCSGMMKVYRISAPSRPQFKGSGFYETDYKGKQK